MPRAVLLRCPICDAVRTLDGGRDARSKAELRETAKAHLGGHLRDESTAAIRKHQVAETATEIIVPTDDVDRLPSGEWRAPDAAWLPEGVSSPAGGPGARFGSSDEAAPMGSNAED